MNWRYEEKDYQLLWADAAKLEVQLARIGRKSERGPRAVWAHLHDMTLTEMAQQHLRMPAWASRALRHPTYRTMVENLTRIVVLESELAATVTLKNVLNESKQRAAIELLKQLTLTGELIPAKDLLAIFKTLHEIDEKLAIPEEARDEEGHTKTPEQILKEEEAQFHEMVDRLPPEWREKYLADYKRKRGQELVDEKVRIKQQMREQQL